VTHASRARWIALLAGAALASGCTREPSEEEIRHATEVMLTSANANPFTQWIAGLGGADKVVEIHELRKLGCKQVAHASGYRCDIELEVSTFGKRQKDRTSVRLVRGQEGWVAMPR
jgi:hypothetical protein